MAEPGAAIDGDIEYALADLAVCRAQLGQMFNVDVNKAQIIVLEAALPFAWLRRGLGWSSIKPLGLEHPIDAVAIEVWQEVPEHEGEIIQGEACRPAHSADNGALFLVHAPSQALEIGRAHV